MAQREINTGGDHNGMTQRDIEDIYNTMGAEGLQRIIASNPVSFANENNTGRVRISPNQTVDLKSGNVTQQGDPVPRPQTLTELINVVNRVKETMPREVAGPLLADMVQRFQEDAGRSPQTVSFNRIMDLPRRQEAFDAAQRGKGGGGLPPALVGAIGTPDFRQRLQDTAGTLDRQSLDTLMNLDRQERQFQLKSGADTTKKSATYEKLRAMAAMGVPLTEDIVMGATNPGIAKSKTYQEALAARNKASGNPPRLFSLGQLTGIADPSQASAQSPDQPADLIAPDGRMRRLGSTLFGD